MKTAPWTSSLSLKLTICLISSLVLIFAFLGYQNVELYRKHLEKMVFSSADAMSDIIKRSTRYSMLRDHRDEVYQIINTIGGEPGIERIRLFNEEGKICFSSVDGEINTFVDKNSEYCRKCHAEEKPLTKLNRPDRVRTYALPSGERILGLINPIENEPSCYNASCHTHRPDQNVLGLLDVTMSLADVDETILEGRKIQVLNLVAAALIVCLTFGALIWGMVLRPVKKLFVGTRHVAAGDLDHKIEVGANDEIGQLAASFNRMTGELKRANNQLKDWARTLESRVEEKTRELKSAHERMIQIERMASMGKLAAVVAHEINNPLAGILTSARFLLKKMASDELSERAKERIREHLEMIADESSRCGEIVKNMLQFTRQTKGDYSPCEVNGLISECLRLVQHKVELMNLQVKEDLAGDIPPIFCDPQEIKQALVAVLINACEATPQGEGIIDVAARYSPEQEKVEISVKDSGTGMDEETRDHIFEPFFTTKEQGKSVGLGLAVVSGIVSRHSGSIEVKSAIGRGTTVVIQLPVAVEGGVAPQVH